tara:strand:+ start:319 stop:903 length:585 start_codon:yes stop_codon:yes gene_type:complete
MKPNLKLIGGQKIESPKSDLTRPTTLMVREAVFNILKNKVENSSWLDLFSGSGSIACEAYNHGAKKIVAIEKDRITAAICSRNLSSLRKSNESKVYVKVICKDVLAWTNPNRKHNSEIISSQKIIFDFIYIDPPYKNNIYDSVLKNIFSSNYINTNTIVICEHSKYTKIKENNLWEIIDKRSYGQTQITFLIKI